MVFEWLIQLLEDRNPRALSRAHAFASDAQREVNVGPHQKGILLPFEDARKSKRQRAWHRKRPRLRGSRVRHPLNETAPFQSKHSRHQGVRLKPACWKMPPACWPPPVAL